MNKIGVFKHHFIAEILEDCLIGTKQIGAVVTKDKMRRFMMLQRFIRKCASDVIIISVALHVYFWISLLAHHQLLPRFTYQHNAYFTQHS